MGTNRRPPVWRRYRQPRKRRFRSTEWGSESTLRSTKTSAACRESRNGLIVSFPAQPPRVRATAPRTQQTDSERPRITVRVCRRQWFPSRGSPETVAAHVFRLRSPTLISSTPAFWVAVTLWRPGDPASHHRRGRSRVDWEGCDPADGTPAACLVAGRIRMRRAFRGSPVGSCAQRAVVPGGRHGTTADPAPRWSALSLCPVAVPALDAVTAAATETVSATDAAPDAVAVIDSDCYLCLSV